MTLPTIVVVKGGDRPISISLFILVYIGPVKTATTASLNRQTYDQEGTINSLNGQFLARKLISSCGEYQRMVYNLIHTGKSFSEVLILASTNPQYDKRFFNELRY